MIRQRLNPMSATRQPHEGTEVADCRHQHKGGNSIRSNSARVDNGLGQSRRPVKVGWALRRTPSETEPARAARYFFFPESSTGEDVYDCCTGKLSCHILKRICAHIESCGKGMQSSFCLFSAASPYWCICLADWLQHHQVKDIVNV